LGVLSFHGFAYTEDNLMLSLTALILPVYLCFRKNKKLFNNLIVTPHAFTSLPLKSAGSEQHELVTKPMGPGDIEKYCRNIVYHI
jgi:hypothetical protein